MLSVMKIYRFFIVLSVLFAALPVFGEEVLRSNTSLQATVATSSATGVGTIATPPPPPQGASVDMYLKIEGVKGESTKGDVPNTGSAVAAPKGSAEAGPALLEIDTIRGESPDRSKSNQGGNTSAGVQYNESDLDFLKDLSEGVSFKLETIKHDFPRESQNEEESEIKPETENIRKNITINIKARTVRGWDPGKKEEVADRAPKSAEEVKTDADLALFLTSAAEADANMEEISLNYEKIVVKYQSSGKLFGFIPLSLTQNVEIDTSAESTKTERVKVRFPWFSFLFSKDISAGEIEEEANKKEGGKDWIEVQSWDWGVNASGQNGITARARAFSLVSNILKTKHDTVKNSINNVR